MTEGRKIRGRGFHDGPGRKQGGLQRRVGKGSMQEPDNALCRGGGARGVRRGEAEAHSPPCHQEKTNKLEREATEGTGRPSERVRKYSDRVVCRAHERN